MATQKKATVTNTSKTNGNSEPKPDKPHGKEHPCKATAYREWESPEIRTTSQLPGRPSVKAGGSPAASLKSDAGNVVEKRLPDHQRSTGFQHPSQTVYSTTRQRVCSLDRFLSLWGMSELK